MRFHDIEYANEALLRRMVQIVNVSYIIFQLKFNILFICLQRKNKYLNKSIPNKQRIKINNDPDNGKLKLEKPQDQDDVSRETGSQIHKR